MNHQKEAESMLLDGEDEYGNGREGIATAYLAIAQTHALLAVAEQLRIANLAELHADGADHVAAGLFDRKRGYMRLRPEIAEALGIEQP